MFTRISRSVSAIIIGAAIAVAVPGGATLALDAKQVLKEKKKSHDDVWEKFFSFRKNGKTKEAASTLEYAAEQGDHAAQWKLGKMYETGDGVRKDPAAAVRFYSKIVENYSDAQPGTADWQFTGNAMVVLGRYYREGVPEAGLRKDRSEAIIMFTTAATYFDHPDAQFELARMYLEDGVGEGDAIQAARMLKLASDQGHAGAHALLGQLLFEGEHLRRDPVRGLSMIIEAQKRASGAESAWISSLQEEAFASASEKERREAVLMIQKQAAQ